MPAKKNLSNLPKPTNSELAILQVLWRDGPSTVKAVQEALGRETGYTTALKFLQIMTEKGLVRRNETARAHVYEAANLQDVPGTSCSSSSSPACSRRPSAARPRGSSCRRLLPNAPRPPSWKKSRNWCAQLSKEAK